MSCETVKIPSPRVKYTKLNIKFIRLKSEYYGVFSIWNDVALIFLDSFFLSFDILFLYTIVGYHKNAFYSFLLVLLSGWISTNNCAMDFNPLASIMIWLTKEVLSLPNSLCVTSPTYSNCSCSILNAKIMADCSDLGIQVSPMFTSVVLIARRHDVRHI